MSTILEDGTGKGYKLKVDSNNRLYASVITESQIDHASELGNRYNLNTGNITLTNDSKTTVFYLKNNEVENEVIISALIYNLGNTDGTGDAIITWVRNPISGDIIDNTNDAGINSNQNYGSAQSLNADVYKGASGETVATGDGDSGSTISTTGEGRITISLGATVVPPGKSISIDYTPPSGNSSQLVNFAIVCFKQTLEA